MATEQTVQTAVWNIELGRGRLIVQWVAVVLVAITLALCFTASRFRGFEKRAAMDQAQLARNIARGEGYTTSVIRPLSLWQMKTYRPDHNALFDPHPDIANPPLYPFLLAGIFRLAGQGVFQAKVSDQIYAPEQWLILPFGQICLLLTLVLVYNWTKQLFDRRVAITAGLILLFSDTLWGYAISGLPTTLLMLLTLSAIYCLFLADRLVSNSPPAAAGLLVASAVLLGLCFLTRYMSFFLVIPLALYVARVMRGRRPVLWALLYLGIFLAVISPWLIRNYQVSHSLLGIAGYDFISSDSLLRSYKVDLSKAWTFRSAASRFVTQFISLWTNAFRNTSTDLLLFFFVVGLLYEFRRDDTARLRRVLVVAFVISIMGMAFAKGSYDPSGPDLDASNLLIVLMPLAAAFGVAFFFLLLDRIQFQMRLTQAAVIGTFAVVNVAPMLFNLISPHRGPFPYPPYCPPYTRILSYWFDANEVGTSDAPWSVAWYADRRCLWLPVTPEEFVEIHDFVAPKNTQFMFLTPYLLDRRSQSEIIKGEFKPWAEAIRGKIPDHFPFRAAQLLWPDNDQIIFAEQPRWQQRPIPGFTDKAAPVKPADTSSTNAPAKPES